MRNGQNLRNTLFLLATLGVAAACGSSTPRWDDTSAAASEPGPGGDPSHPASEDGSTPSGDDSGHPVVPGGDDSGPPSDASVPDPVDAAIYATPVQCSSGTTWTQGDTKSDLMKPGSACRTCHVLGGSASGKTWDISGTVYKTAHEPDDCNGTSASGVTVVITDAKGVQTSLPVNAVGNFYHADLFGFGKIPTPYTAKVVAGGKTREMLTPQTEGDCDSCHTESGTKLAPGRIMLP